MSRRDEESRGAALFFWEDRPTSKVQGHHRFFSMAQVQTFVAGQGLIMCD